MAVNLRTVTGKTTVPAPITYTITGTVDVDSNNVNNLQYSGSSPLDNFGTPPNTGTVEPIIIDGETGLGPQNCGMGIQAYAYLLIDQSSKYTLVKIIGIERTSFISGTYTYLIYTDTDNTGISGASIQIVFGKLIGYSISNTGGANATANGVTIPDGVTISETQLSPSENRSGLQPPVLLDGTGTSVLIQENS